MGELMQTPTSLGSGRPLGIDARWQRITTPRNESRGGGRDAPDGYACALSMLLRMSRGNFFQLAASSDKTGMGH